MSREIDSAALTTLNRLLGIAGVGSAQTTLEDGVLQQVIDVSSVVRRSRTPGTSTGYFLCPMLNDHAGADDEESQINPYTPGVLVNPAGGYPPVVRDGFDVWIVGATASRSAGAGDLTGGVVEIEHQSTDIGWGVTDTGAILTSSTPTCFTAFAVLNTLAAGATPFAAEIGTGLLHSRAAIRVRRGQVIHWQTTSGGAMEALLILDIGLFPASLGQDIVP